MHAVDTIIGVGWAAFWLYWLSQSLNVKPGHSRWQQAGGARLAIALAVILLLRIHALHRHATHDPWLEGIGLAMFLLGIGLAIWARVYLGRNWGTPMTEKVEPELVTTGPYRWIRNPIYTGIILAGLGTAVAVSIEWLVVVVLGGSYFVYSAFMEQRFMAAL